MIPHLSSVGVTPKHVTTQTDPGAVDMNFAIVRNTLNEHEHTLESLRKDMDSLHDFFLWTRENYPSALPEYNMAMAAKARIGAE